MEEAQELMFDPTLEETELVIASGWEGFFDGKTFDFGGPSRESFT
jgi:hypothetical protein